MGVIVEIAVQAARAIYVLTLKTMRLKKKSFVQKKVDDKSNSFTNCYHLNGLGVMIYRLVSKGKDVRLLCSATCSIMYRGTVEKPSRDCVHLGADSNQDAEG